MGADGATRVLRGQAAASGRLILARARCRIDRRFEEEIAQGRLRLPDHPTAGYRMLGPITAYDTRTATFTAAIEKWQSVHFPYRTAEELGLPTTREGTMPYVMASGTWWSHVMIEHTRAK